MTIATAYTNSATISTTEYSLPNNSTTLATLTAVAIYQVFIDASALVAGDAYRITIYEAVQAAGTKRVAWAETLTGAQGGPVWVSPSMILMNGWDVTAIRLSGADRVIGWSIRSVA